MDYKFKISKIIGSGLIFLVLPQITFASGVTDIIDAAFSLVNTILIPLAFVLCVLYFFWGMAKYIRTGAASEEAAKEGKRVMIWGVVGIFVAFSVWGIISFIQTELAIPPVQPTGPGTGSGSAGGTGSTAANTGNVFDNSPSFCDPSGPNFGTAACN